MNRSAFLRSLVVGASALIVGDEALETFARLTHQRKSFPSAAIPQKWGGVGYYFDTPITATEILEREKAFREYANRSLDKTLRAMRAQIYRQYYPWLRNDAFIASSLGA